jgi:hypothetical protein
VADDLGITKIPQLIMSLKLIVMIDLIIRVANFDYKIQKMPGRLMYIEA